jgi:uncharacterized iron-regulated membrane protein
MFRKLCVRLHRYAGLAMAIFLTIAGLTGSVIAFQDELDAWLNPELFRTTSSGAALSPSELIARIERFDPRLRVTYMPLQFAPGEAIRVGVEARLDPATARAFALDYDEIFVDPISGDVLGRRQWGACCFAPQQLIPFLYKLHYSLHLPGAWGVWLMGLVALLWAMDCFVGAYLTWPRRRPFFARWKPAWKIKRRASAYRRNFDLHRAGGLWFWGVLLTLAVSGVYFNLHDEVFRPIVAFFSPLTPGVFEQRQAHSPEAPIEAAISFEEVIAHARAEAARRGWSHVPGGVSYRPAYGIYAVDFFATPHDHGAGLGSAFLYFDGRNGRLLGARVPGEGTAGDIFMRLQFPLHSGQIAGLPGRIIVCLTGLVVAMLSSTGVVIWWKKHQGRRRAGERRIERAVHEHRARRP